VEQRLGWLAAELDAAVGRRVGLPAHEEMAALVALVCEEHTKTPRATPLDAVALSEELDDELTRIASLFGFSSLDAGLLVEAAAVDLDVRIGALYGLLAGLSTQTRPTVALALELCGYGSMDPAARMRLGPLMPLRRHGLLQIEDETLPFLARRLVVPDRVVGHLLGDHSPDPLLAPLRIDVPIAGASELEELTAGLRVGARIVHLRAKPGSLGPSAAVRALDALGIGHVAFDLRRAPPGLDAEHVAELCLRALREAALVGAALVVCDPEGLLVAQRGAYAHMETSPVPVVVVDDESWEPAWFEEAVLELDAPVFTHPERVELWEAAVGTEPARDRATWEKVLALRLTPLQILASARAAHLHAATRGALDATTVAETARRQGAVRLRGATLIARPSARLEDVIVLPRTKTALEMVVSWGRQREALLAESGLAGKGTKGKGIVALFAGSPGTGKTLAAEAIAGELGLALCVADLSAMIDKYIGETEKNLERLISEAENLNVVLFFDEADALFGVRSTVHDARDRYANQEVSYLLQRIERFEGIAVLATNLKESMDQAFVRRLHHVIVFDDPDPPTRKLLWEAHLAALPAQASDDPIDLDWLSEAVELTGGGIRNVVMAAAFAAGAEGRPVGMTHLRNAVRREYSKLGRLASFVDQPAALPTR
jgi:ATP-dependent 26S proteasome regulatory subunit